MPTTRKKKYNNTINTTKTNKYIQIKIQKPKQFRSVNKINTIQLRKRHVNNNYNYDMGVFFIYIHTDKKTNNIRLKKNRNKQKKTRSLSFKRQAVDKLKS